MELNREKGKLIRSKKEGKWERKKMKLRCGHAGTIENPYFHRGKGLISEMGL